MFNGKFLILFLVAILVSEFFGVFGSPTNGKTYARKKRKLNPKKNDEWKPNPSPPSSSLIKKQIADIFRLDKDCMIEYFHHLPVAALNALRQTSSEYRQNAGVYFQQHFPARVFGNGGNIYTEYGGDEINSLIPFVKSILMLDGDLSTFEKFRFTSLKEIEFNRETITSVANLSYVMPNLETLKFVNSELEGDLDEMFLSHCGNLKRLYVKDTDLEGNEGYFFVGYSNEWLGKKYTSLEHLEINSDRRNDDVIEFLKRNPNIRKFSCKIEFLVRNMYTIWSSGIKLDTLSILFHTPHVTEDQFELLGEHLKTLHGRKFFKDLHLYVEDNEEELEIPAGILSYITVLHNTDNERNFDLTQYKNLQQLSIYEIHQISNVNATLGHLNDLKNLHFFIESIEHILPFIRRLPKLEHIKIVNLRQGIHYNGNSKVINMTALNNERKHVKRGLTIYVMELVYLATRKAYNGQPIEYIQIERIDEYDEFSDFTHYNGFVV